MPVTVAADFKYDARNCRLQPILLDRIAEANKSGKPIEDRDLTGKPLIP
ncbi:hypothetical protein TIFTF001_030029 [Ficus carica]|uniref:Uncharacterized protein n=1 Tax=Ficus carica TaxID=3494 RepID=A0AA88J374_FICCA|nr:hypothetical protein TIFTF001_030029 [Ficus carica]